MTQEEMTELDMDVFSKYIGPYFTWLESNIESGWQQSDSVQKDVLKEVRSIATTMRARFILGVTRNDFAKEIERAMDVLELAVEAFPQESEEIEAKIQQLTSGIAEKLGNDFVPGKFRSRIPSVPKVELKIVEKIEKQVSNVQVTRQEVKQAAAQASTARVQVAKTKVEKAKNQVNKQEVKSEAKPVTKTVANPTAKFQKESTIAVKKQATQKSGSKAVSAFKKKSRAAPEKLKPKKKGFFSRVLKSFLYGSTVFTP
ncbi:MAG TPA: hypothetical protein VJJ82_03265 [Candidatus Nanoarchaeia archaeon]|nr:hypothetical protein [Candidatus Nanoarchaeia archaeon]